MGDGGILGRNISRRRFLAASVATAGAAAGLGISPCDPYMVRKIQQEKNGQLFNHRSGCGSSRLTAAWRRSAPSCRARTSASSSRRTTEPTGCRSTTTTPMPSAAVSARRTSPLLRGARHPVPRVVRREGNRSRTRGADVRRGSCRGCTQCRAGSGRRIGFLVGSAGDADHFGNRLRTLSPYGRVDISIDPRPWRINLVPMPQFVALSDGIWPQLYWDTFNTSGNLTGYRNAGFHGPKRGHDSRVSARRDGSDPGAVRAADQSDRAGCGRRCADMAALHASCMGAGSARGVRVAPGRNA